MSPADIASFVYAVAAGVALAACVIMWRRRDAPGGLPLALMLLAATFWAVCDAIELHLSTSAGKQLISQIQYIGVVSAAPLFFHAAMELTGLAGRVTRRGLLAIWAVPVASLGLAWTNPWHHWLWTGIELPSGGSPFSIYRYGWWFWVLMAQNYLLMYPEFDEKTSRRRD